MAKYRKKPVVIEAMQFHGPSIAGVDEMVSFDDWMVANQGDRKCRYSGNQLIIPTLEGEMTALPGDWIIRGVKGELYPCKPDIFEATYSAADDDPASDLHRVRTDAFREGALWFSGTMGPVASRITVNEAAQRYADHFLANKAA